MKRILCRYAAALTLLLVFAAPAAAQFNASPRLPGRARPGADDGDAAHRPALALTAHQRASFDKAEQALHQEVSCDFLESPLSEVVAKLQRSVGCPIVIDELALADAAIGTDSPVTISLGRTTLRTALDQCLKPHALGWSLKPPGIVITTQGQLDTDPAYRYVVTYPVRDLLAPPGAGEDMYDFDTLIDLLTVTVHRESWRDLGTGDGEIAPFVTSAAIVVTQTWEVHEEIAAVLAALRKVQRQQGLAPRRTSGVSVEEDQSRDDRYYQPRPRPSQRQRTRY